MKLVSLSLLHFLRETKSPNTRFELDVSTVTGWKDRPLPQFGQLIFGSDFEAVTRLRNVPCGVERGISGSDLSLSVPRTQPSRTVVGAIDCLLAVQLVVTFWFLMLCSRERGEWAV